MGLVGDLQLVGGLLVGLVVTYLVSGLMIDLARALRRRSASRARAELATLLLADEAEAGVVAEQLAHQGPAVLLPLVQRLAADLGGDADLRLRRLVGSAGLAHEVTRRLRSRRWRRRTQAAALAPLLPTDDPRRLVLLHDRHPMVRARAALHLETDDAVTAAPELLELLGDSSAAVRFAAQQALLRADGRVMEPLLDYLSDPSRPGLGLALEVAAQMPDPALQPAVRALATSVDPRIRALATGALAADEPGLARLCANLADEDPGVRAAATDAVGRIGAAELCPALGERLGDRSWEVRLHAGRALAAVGAVGSLTLRHHLLDPDPYARDMARRALDDIEAREGRPVLPVRIPAGLDPWPETPATAEAVA